MKLWPWCLFTAVVLLASLQPARAQSPEFRGLWVDAWGTGFLDANQVTQLVNDCRNYNFNAIVVQMRRRGDAFYNPGITGNDPKTTAINSSFDALADIINKAHNGTPRIEVHCWVTTFLVWSGTSQPSQTGHVVRAHPEYLMRNSAGTNYLSEGYYLDPGHPEATLWNYVMATNIVRRYNVDGFHWDYVRYPVADSGYNPVAIARYNAEFGLAGQPSPSSTQFANWRRRQVTDFVRWVNGELLAIRPNLLVSCSVFGSRTDAYNARYQDWAAWNAEGILDLCMPMGYTADFSLFTSRVNDAYNNQGVRRVYMGQGSYLNTKENTVAQLNLIRSQPLLGSMFYSYRTPNSGTVDRPATLAYVRDNYQPSWVNVPSIPWKTAPTKGIVRGKVTRSDTGAILYNATVRLLGSPTRTQLTEVHGTYGFFETTPGTYSVTATAAGLGTVTNTAIVTAGGNVTVNLVVPAVDNTPPAITSVVASGITDSSATIAWVTDENANSAVDYGPTAAYGSLATNAAMVQNHSLVLTGLTPNTTYHYRVRSRNAAGLQAASGNATFISNPPGVVNDVIVESRKPDGTLTGNPPYTDSGFSDSTLKSSAPGLLGGGSRYAASGTPSFTLRPSLQVSGGTYAVYLTHGNATSVSDDIVVSIAQSGCTGLPATTGILREPNANSWEYLGILTLNPGVTTPVLTFTLSSGALSGTSRMYSDSAKFVYFMPPQPPVILNAPESRSVVQGASTTFTVSVSGAAPITYHWMFEGAFIPGATASSYPLQNIQPSHEGEYCVVITNAMGSITSAPAFLAVHVPPTIVAQPVDLRVNPGSSAGFFVTASGTEPFSYQWRFFGTNLPGAAESTYDLESVQMADAGPYTVIVTNIAGAVTSAVATLTVTLPVPPAFEHITLLPDGRTSLVATGEVNTVYTLEGSTNLQTWTDLLNVTNLTGSVPIIYEAPSNSMIRFYRLRR
ncbi:MAG TPA: family 10 glycosylhydrolase [Clostridia bacterium]|nr:family 10 glycosylhydrolase [Clostridia bacterium]